MIRKKMLDRRANLLTSFPPRIFTSLSSGLGVIHRPRFFAQIDVENS